MPGATGTLAVFGDSVLWGQGLREEDKIHSLVRRRLADRGIQLQLHQPIAAHSGAPIGVGQSGARTSDSGEVPQDHPTIWRQVDTFPDQETRDVALILLNGGINDVGVMTILNPTVSAAEIRRMTQDRIAVGMRVLLHKLLEKFGDGRRFHSPDLRVVVTGYYAAVSPDTSIDFLHVYAQAAGALVGMLWGGVAGAFLGSSFGGVLGVLSEVEKLRMAENFRVFDEESRAQLRNVVEETNAVLGTPSIRLAAPYIAEMHAARAGDPWLFGINPDLTAEDPLAVERQAACRASGSDNLTCWLASAGHPNERGAIEFADQILAQLGAPLRTRPHLFQPGSARDMVKDGVWFKDKDGRYALFRGVNLGPRSKRPPYIPLLPLERTLLDDGVFAAELEARARELDLLQELGMNVARLCVMWKGVEPDRNVDPNNLPAAGVQYLEQVGKLADALFHRGIYCIIDFHQDIAHESYNGDGFPDWAIGIDPNHPRPGRLAWDDDKWGIRYCDERAVFPFGNDKHKLVRNTLRSFWDNSLRNTEAGLDQYRIQDHAVLTLGRIARFFFERGQAGGHPAILGYEPFNEPHQVGIRKRDFEASILPIFYGKVWREIRRHDERAFFFLDPRMDWTTFPAAAGECAGLNMVRDANEIETYLDVSALDRSRLVFSFHYYDPWLLTWGTVPGIRDADVDIHSRLTHWPKVFRKLVAAGEERDMVPFLTEFGASQDWRFVVNFRQDAYHGSSVRACMDMQFENVEAERLNAIYWAYDLYSTQQGHDNWNGENFSLLGPDRQLRHADIVARPYPMRSSARLQRLVFSLGSEHFAMQLEGVPVEAPTVIYLPRRLHYEDGFEVRASGEGAAWDEHRQLLSWWPDPGSELHTLIVAPRGRFDVTALEAWARAALPQTKFHNLCGKLYLSVRRLDMGRAVVCRGAVKDFEVFNWGAEDLHILEVKVQGEGFEAAPSDLVIRPGDKSNVTVTFGPADARDYRGSVTIRTSDPSADDPVVEVTGVGYIVPPTLYFPPQTRFEQDFCGVLVQTSDKLSIEIQNRGSQDLRIALEQPTDPAFRATAPAVVPCAGKAEIEVEFQPQDNKAYSADLYVTSNDPARLRCLFRLRGFGANVVPAVRCEELRVERAALQQELAGAGGVRKAEIMKAIREIDAEMRHLCCHRY